MQINVGNLDRIARIVVGLVLFSLPFWLHSSWLAWLLQDGGSRVQRRVQKVISQHESRVCRIIVRAKQQGLVPAEVEPQTAAIFFVGMLPALALRMGGDARERVLLLRGSLDVFAAYKARLAAASA